MAGTLQPGVSLAVIARQYGVNANQVLPLAKAVGWSWGPRQHNWCRMRISDVVSGEQAPTKFYAGVIVVELGRARIRVEGVVDADSLRLIRERLGR